MRADAPPERAVVRIQLHAGALFTSDEAIPTLLLLGSLRAGPVSFEVGLATFFIRTDVAAGLRVFPLSSHGRALSIGVRATRPLVEVREVNDPTVMVSAGYEHAFGRRGLFSVELGSWWILENQSPDQALILLLGFGRQID